jgi:DNA-binding Lrp family transcriptional regulator
MSKFDDLDKAIILRLHQDARIPSAVIARQLNQSPRTVQNRIQRLVDQGVIQLAAVIDPLSFGYNLRVDIFCEIEAGQIDQAIDRISQMQNVTYLAISTGDQDVSLQAIFRDSLEMQDFITRQLHQVPGMRRTRTVLLPRLIKDSHQWLPPEESF